MSSQEAPRGVVLLGSTGSIGTQCLDVIERAPGRFKVLALAAGVNRLSELAEQTVRFEVATVAVPDAESAAQLSELLTQIAKTRQRTLHRVELLHGPTAATELAGRTEIDGAAVDVCLNGITGAKGLEPTLAALRAGTTLALANKESLIIGGELVLAAKQRADQIVPVDSEHSAIAQALRSGRQSEVGRLILTASGGPFRGWDRSALAKVTPAQALAHPTWEMGPVISINSATLVNKGLEVIEASLLFDIDYADIDVVVHPQSLVHSMVEFTDGSTIAQISPPDMRLPIALALGWPDRVPHAVPGCDWTQSATWTFEPVDETVFEALALARRAGEASGTHPAVFNAANEVCVQAFLEGKLSFVEIINIIGKVLEALELNEFAGNQQKLGSRLTLESVFVADAWARRAAAQMVEGLQ